MISIEAKRYLESRDKTFLRRLASHYFDLELEYIENVVYVGCLKGLHSVMAEFIAITKNVTNCIPFQVMINPETGAISKKLGYSGDFE